MPTNDIALDALPPDTHAKSPLRTLLTSLVGPECLERRPGRDPLTGNRTDGQSDTDDTWPDRLPCTRQHGHSDDHSDALGRTWRKGEVPA
ncbi:hypothetical protein [Streptomyces marincola]|uniref:Uncharacterized protein n=1 Tax=Streptomyces marincola TaxID=2878388 RepID=A0A1W7CYH4_9ACTN|nr:hypothetical protein [Streptomyces marincola]ARQ69901.1 hypothetical protein CAG99_14435 [Streptomyces marincola]